MKYCIVIAGILIQTLVFGQKNEAAQDWPNLQKYATDNAVLLQTPATQNRVVFMGNSITEFWKVRDSSFFAVHPNYIDRGISGQTTPQMLLRFRQDVIDLKPAVVVILAGINDIAENTGPISLNTTMGNIASMAELAGVHHIKVILCAVLPANHFPWHPGIYPADKVIALNKMIQEYATARHLTYVDFYKPMADADKGLDAKYTLDGVHPTLAGYQIMDALVEKAIRHTLRKN
ncbi:GDSL-type esterase/lipase family protein [Hydrotalea sp.]|uniref:GDSL-type esterase/lipase family protein n=1 Tax=Hydrotalea sp. TaxID=2881279 RepID=UPI00263157EF|nr:GDSL-type esterase/lipase family protein [Hydrotalea sp.]